MASFKSGMAETSKLTKKLQKEKLKLQTEMEGLRRKTHESDVALVELLSERGPSRRRTPSSGATRPTSTATQTTAACCTRRSGSRGCAAPSEAAPLQNLPMMAPAPTSARAGGREHKNNRRIK